MKKNNFVEGTLIATIAIVLVKFLGMIYVIPFYKIVGESGGSLYSYAYNIYLLFLGISSAGLPSAISKIISEYNTLGMIDAKNKAYDIAKKMLVVISVVAFAVLFIFAEEIAKLYGINEHNSVADIAFVIRCVAPAILVIPFLSITKGYLQGHKYVAASSLSQLIEQVVRIFVILCGSYIIMKLFDNSLKLAVGIAVSGAFFGGLAAYLYLKYAIKKNKNEINKIDENSEIVKTNKNKIVRTKDIIKKIIAYAVPFIIINIVTNLYNNIDQLLVLRTLKSIPKYNGSVEFIASSISTWSPKICMIINAVAMGMTMSLIPTIVSSYAKKDKKDVENQVNKSISMIIYISAPLVVGLVSLSIPVWKVFYSANSYGPMILRLALISAFFANIYMVISTILQSLNKYKAVYTVSIIGFVLNAVLDVPLMLLFNYLGIEAFLGSIVASIIGFSTSVVIGMIWLHKQEHIKFKNTFSVIRRTILVSVVMFIPLLILNLIFKLDITTLTTARAFIVIIGYMLIGAPIFIGLSYKLKLIDDVLGHEMVSKLIKKLSFGKINI